MGATVIALLSNIEANQNEIISAMINQISSFVEDVYVIDFYKNSKIHKVTNNESINIIKANQWNHNTWSSIYRHYRYLVEGCENVILIKTPILRDNNVQLDEKLLKEISKQVMKDDTWNMQYDMMKRLIERLLFVRACQTKNVYQFMIDPDEVDFSKVWNFKKYKRFAACRWNGIKYGPIYEWALYNTFVQPLPKAQDLYYIASAYNERRENYVKHITETVNKKFGKKRIGYVRNNQKKGKVDYFTLNDRDKRVTQSMYLYNLMISKYTIVNNSYNVDCFNMVRFMEAVICNCVPLILYGNNLEDLKLTFPDIYDIIRERNLVVRPDDVSVRLTKYMEDSHNGSVRKMKLSEEELNEPDVTVCELIKSTNSFKKITDYNKVKKFYDSLLR